MCRLYWGGSVSGAFLVFHHWRPCMPKQRIAVCPLYWGGSMIPELNSFPTGRDGPLADMLRDMTPLDRGILLQTNPRAIIPALIADLRLPVEFPVQPVKKPAENPK